MNYIKMIIALYITFYAIIKIMEKNDRIIIACIIYYTVCVFNDIFNGSNTIELANCFNVSYQFSDMILVIMIGVIIFKFIRDLKININIYSIILLNIFIILFLNILRGILTFGITSEWIGDIRTLLSFFIAIIFFKNYFKVESLSKYYKIVDCVMMVILIISIILWILDIGLGINSLESQQNALLSDGGSTMRFIQPYQVIIIAIYSIYLINNDIEAKGHIGIKSIIFSLAVMLFQHRSVWVSFISGVIIIFIRQIIKNKISYKLICEVIILFIVIAGIIIFSNSEIVENIKNSFNLFYEIFTGGDFSNTTFNTRSLVWNAVIDDLQGLDKIIGQPFGSGYAKSIGWETSPHSSYIRCMARIGFLGTILLILMLTNLIIKLNKYKIAYLIESLIVIIVFMYSYDFTILCGAIIGIGINLVLDKKKEKLKIHSYYN